MGWKQFWKRDNNQPGAETTAPAEERPFGEDITNPDSRTMPEPLQGRWVFPTHSDRDPLTITSSTIKNQDEEEQVVAVRFINANDTGTTSNVAVVTRGADGQFALRYFGISDDGVLVDLESMDVKRVRSS